MKYQILGRHDRFERTLRKRQTEGEEMLWHFLRNRRFHGLKFRRQHRVDYFYLDFYCPELKLAIEIDGKPHFDEMGKAYDAMRTRVLGKRGIRVLRFVNGKVAIDPESVLRELESAIPLSPSSDGERG